MKKLPLTLAIASLLNCATSLAGTFPIPANTGSRTLFKKSIHSASLMKAYDDDEQPKAVVKLNLSQLALKNISLQGEYGFHKNMSGALGVNFLLSRPFPSFFTEKDPTGEGLRNTAFKGMAITPEFRFYPGRKEEQQAPHGFYIGAYYRYSKHTLTSDYTEHFKSGKSYSYDMEVTYKGSNGGIMIGSQWLIGKHFSIDWWILGGGFGSAKFKMEAIGSGFIMNDDERAEVKASVEDELKNVTLFGFDTDVTTTTNSVKAEVKGLPMFSFRGFGLCLGFAF